MKKAFTLIELLVVIAIIAILAAILFPVFAQAKLAAKKTVDLSNQKQNMTATLMYAGDADDYLPVTCKQEDYIFAARIMPYTKNRDIFKNQAIGIKQGTVQHQKADNPDFSSPPGYMLDPNDPCVGLGVSTAGGAKYYNDIYPPIDYRVNQSIYGYQKEPATNACGASGRYKYVDVAPNTSGGGTMGSNAGGDGGAEDIGPNDGATEIVSPAKAIVWINFAGNGLIWPGSNIKGFWGTKTGYWNEGSNVAFMDGHAGYFKGTRLFPNLKSDGTLLYTDGWDQTKEGTTNPTNVGWAAGSPHPEQNGRSWNWWGTNRATPDNQ